MVALRRNAVPLRRLCTDRARATAFDKTRKNTLERITLTLKFRAPAADPRLVGQRERQVDGVRAAQIASSEGFGDEKIGFACAARRPARSATTLLIT
jgi:hypothetical protein